MHGTSSISKEIYAGGTVALVPGGGTFAMKAGTRQISVDSVQWLIFLPWSQIFEVGSISASEVVMKARCTGNDAQAAFAPAHMEEVVAKITAD